LIFILNTFATKIFKEKKMKKIIVFLALAVTIVSCSNVGKDEFIVNGSIKGIPDGKVVVLERFDDSLGAITVDTAKVKDGKFTFNGKTLEPELHSIRVETVQNSSYLIIENGEIDLDIVKDSTFQNKISGTYNNDQLFEFNKKGIESEKKKKEFGKKYQAKFLLAQNQKDTATMKKIQTDYEALEKSMKAETEEYVKSHPKAIIAALLIKSLFGEFEPDVTKIQTLFNGLDKSIQDTKVGKSILKNLKEFKIVKPGRRAPEFSAPNVDGKSVSLKESLGKVTIVDFWASWCGPCRKENPNMVKLYAEFHDKGLNIIGVSLDDDATKWKEAIAADNLTWTQVSNLKKWKDPIAAEYGVDAIPSTFVLNQFGVVVAKNISGEALKAKIAELLAAK
jgi:peroxiredoxin